jgi:hypothetical protein
MGFEIDYLGGERMGCTSKLVIADRIFYVKLFSSDILPRFYSGDQNGIVQKEISEAEFKLWLNVLADNEADVEEIISKINSGKRY